MWHRKTAGTVAGEMGVYDPLRCWCAGRNKELWRTDLRRFYYPCSKKRKHLKDTWVVLGEENGHNGVRKSTEDPRLKIRPYLCELEWGRGILPLFPFGMKQGGGVLED